MENDTKINIRCLDAGYLKKINNKHSKLYFYANT